MPEEEFKLKLLVVEPKEREPVPVIVGMSHGKTALTSAIAHALEKNHGDHVVLVCDSAKDFHKLKSDAELHGLTVVEDVAGITKEAAEVLATLHRKRIAEIPDIPVMQVRTAFESDRKQKPKPRKQDFQRANQKYNRRRIF